MRSSWSLVLIIGWSSGSLNRFSEKRSIADVEWYYSQWNKWHVLSSRFPGVLPRGVLPVHRPTHKKRVMELGLGSGPNDCGIVRLSSVEVLPKAAPSHSSSYASTLCEMHFVFFLLAFVPSSNQLTRPINQLVAGRSTRWFHDRLIGE